MHLRKAWIGVGVVAAAASVLCLLGRRGVGSLNSGTTLPADTPPGESQPGPLFVGTADPGQPVCRIRIHLTPAQAFSGDGWRIGVISPANECAISDTLAEPAAEFLAMPSQRQGEWFVFAGRLASNALPRWHSATFNAADGAPLELNWQLPIDKTASISGVVLNRDGSPRAGIKIACRWCVCLRDTIQSKAFRQAAGGAGAIEYVSDPTGRFVLEDVSTELWLTFSHLPENPLDDKYLWETDLPLATTVPGTFRAVEPMTYSLLLRPDNSMNLEVALTAVDGSPVQDAILGVLYERTDGGSVWVDEAQCVARGNGVWTFSPRTTLGSSALSLWGRRFWVAAFAPDGRASFEEGVLHTGAKLDLRLDERRPAVSLRARVVDIETGDAIPDCPIVLQHATAPGRSLRVAITDKDGWASIPGVVMPPESWSRGHLQTSGYSVMAGQEQIGKTLRWLNMKGGGCPDSLKNGLAISPDVLPTLQLKN
ncbi:MAG: hypothetical protein HYY18_01330 [Planctomycetes bacterium]|nr:hypothetical protein [Planctomycetota bacterium]